MSDFYEFEHECGQMPDNVKFCKIKDAISSQFSVEYSKRGFGFLGTVLWGFRFCPYCGEDMERVSGDDQ